MAGRMRSRSRSPLRSKNGILGGERRAPPPRDRSGKLNQSSDKMVYLSNLPFELTWMELKDFVREKAGEVNFVETLENREGKSKGCAVVEFKSRESAEKCVEAMHRTELRGRLIVVKEIRDPVAFFRKVREDTGVDFLGSRDRGVDRRAPPSRTLPSAADSETYGLSPAFLDQLKIKLPLVNRIFLTNISYACGVGRLYDVCSLAGKITWLDLQMDKEGKSKGMAVCQYSHPIEAVQAVSMLHDQRLFDRTLSVKMDRFDKDPSTERREGELPVGLRGIGMGLGAGGAPLTDVASVISSIAAPPSAPTPVVHHLNGNSQLAQLAASGNPYGASSNPFSAGSNPQIQLQSAQIQQSQPSAYDHPTSFHTTPSGYGTTSGGQSLSQPPAQSYYNGPASGGPGGQVVQPTNGPHFFAKPNSGVQAKQEYVKQDYGNRDVGGYGSAAAQLQPSQHGSAYGGGGTASSVVPASGGYGGGHGYESQTTTRIILIKNLPLDYTWTIVSDRVQQYGDLESVEMISQGVAKVRFVQLSDAERARANLHGTTVEGRVIAIEYL